MSCGQHHEVPCSQIADSLSAFLDQEHSDMEATVLRHHLEECPPCAQEADAIQVVKSLVARACCEEPAPDAVWAKISLQITQIQVEITRVIRQVD